MNEKPIPGEVGLLVGIVLGIYIMVCLITVINACI
jgi:hypothetical protein